MNIFIKTLIIINGILIPILIGLFFFQFFKSTNSKPEYEIVEEEIIVGERLKKAKTDSLALQGLSFDSPRGIYNSTNCYLPIAVNTYKEAKDIREMASRAADLSMSYLHIMNVVFLDQNFNVIGTLLDKKASIMDIEIPYGRYYRDEEVDKTVQNIAYLIGFEDTNNDGKLNSKDHHDLYISDLNGKNLVQATKGIDIESFEFIKSHSQILIHYKDRSNMREEHKKMRFGIFDIKASEFKLLSELDRTLDELERMLIN